MKETKAKSELTLQQVKKLARKKSYRDEAVPVLRWEDVEELGLLSKTLHKQNNRLLKEGEEPVARYWIRGTKWVDVYHISQTEPPAPLSEKQKKAKETRIKNATCQKCGEVNYFSPNRPMPLEKEYFKPSTANAQQQDTIIFPKSLLEVRLCGKCRLEVKNMHDDLCKQEKRQLELKRKNPKNVFLWQTIGNAMHPLIQAEILELMVINLDGDVILHERIKPKGKIHQDVTEKYGYTSEMLSDATPFVRVYSKLIPYMESENLFLMHQPSREIGKKFMSSYLKNKDEISFNFMSDKEEWEKENLVKFFEYKYCPSPLKEEFENYLEYEVKAEDPNSFRDKMLMLHNIVTRLLKEDVWKHPKWTHFQCGWGINE